MTPTKYELLIDRGRIVLRGYSPECERGYFDVESHPYKTGASLPSLRKQGAKRAKHFGVPFVDKTAN
jgi:hypothetical protein